MSLLRTGQIIVPPTSSPRRLISTPSTPRAPSWTTYLHQLPPHPPHTMNRGGIQSLTPHQLQQLKLHQQQLQQEQQKQHHHQQQQQQQLKLRPLGVSQLANVQAAQAARSKISERKSLLMEDDMEFCPQTTEPSPQMRPTLLKRGNPQMISVSQGSYHHTQMMSSPFSTPAKMSTQSMGRLQGQQGYLRHSPQPMMVSPSHIYSSPQGIMRRMDNMYGGAQSPGRW